MDGFADNFGDVDPAAEFLAREQNELAGLEDELGPVTSAPTSLDGFEGPTGGSPPVDSFRALNVNDNQIFNDDLASTDPQFGDPVSFGDVQFNSSEEPSAPVIRAPREEPEKIKLWREEQKKRLEEKDLNEEKKKEEWREAAKKELEEWYRHHEDLIAKTKATNRNAEKEQVADEGEIVPGTEWERIAKLCDFNPKASKATKDVSRMRSIILQLKQNPLPSKSS